MDQASCKPGQSRGGPGHSDSHCSRFTELDFKWLRFLQWRRQSKAIRGSDACSGPDLRRSRRKRGGCRASFGQPTLKGSPGGFESIQTLASVVFQELRKEERIERIGAVPPARFPGPVVPVGAVRVLPLREREDRIHRLHSSRLHDVDWKRRGPIHALRAFSAVFSRRETKRWP